jgi:hypothetical protein
VEAVLSALSAASEATPAVASLSTPPLSPLVAPPAIAAAEPATGVAGQPNWHSVFDATTSQTPILNCLGMVQPFECWGFFSCCTCGMIGLVISQGLWDIGCLLLDHPLMPATGLRLVYTAPHSSLAPTRYSALSAYLAWEHLNSLHDPDSTPRLRFLRKVCCCEIIWNCVFAQVVWADLQCSQLLEKGADVNELQYVEAPATWQKPVSLPPRAAILPQAESLVPGSPVKLDILRILLEVRIMCADKSVLTVLSLALAPQA